MNKTTMKTFGTSNREGHDSSNFYARKMFSEVLKPTADGGETSQNINEIPADKLDSIFVHSSENMHELPDNSVHLMITSPPYNVGKDYDADLHLEEYLELLDSVWRETFRVLVPGGRACINVANVGRKPYLPLSSLINVSMLNIGYLMRGEIIWNKSASAGSSCAWGSWLSASNPTLRDTHEYILVFSKDRYDRKLKDAVSTIERDEFLQSTKSVWDMPTESAKRVKHPAPFPVELPRRLMELYTYSNEVVLDPFIGSGSTAVACVHTGRQFVGYDTSVDYVNVANERIEDCRRSIL